MQVEPQTVAEAGPSVEPDKVGKKRSRAAEEDTKKDPPTAPIADELSLPLQAIMRIVKAKLPDGMMVGTDTKKGFAKACSLFILYVSTMCACAGKTQSSASCIHRPSPICMHFLCSLTPSHLPQTHVSCSPVHAYSRRASLVHASLTFAPSIPSLRSAADVAKENSRSTVAAQDVLSALKELEFDDFILPVEGALATFRETEKARQIENAAKRAAKEANNPKPAVAEGEADGEAEAEEEGAAAAADDEAKAEEEEPVDVVGGAPTPEDEDAPDSAAKE